MFILLFCFSVQDIKDNKQYSKKGYEIIIYDKEDIENQVFMNDPNKKVDEYTLNIDSHNNVLRYNKNGYELRP